MWSSVVSKGKFPKKSVGAGGCFCARRILSAVLECVFPPDDSSTAGAAGRPAKSSPEIEPD